MWLIGRYSNKKKGVGFNVLVNHTKKRIEIGILDNGNLVGAYKKEDGNEYCFATDNGKMVGDLIANAIRGCNSKNGMPHVFIHGASVLHTFKKSKMEYEVELYTGELCSLDIKGEFENINLSMTEGQMPEGIPYVKLTKEKVKIENEFGELSDEDVVQVRTVEEIALTKKDVTWLKDKKYYVVNDDETAEKIFSLLDNFPAGKEIAYDTETTGLKINCFGKINSGYARELERYNSEHKQDPIRADKLVGIIFCVEKDVSYYFPCANKKFKNLFQDKESEVRKRIVNYIKAKYTIGELRDKKGDMADYIRNTNSDDWGLDVILMERVRNILESKHIVAHNGSFEWKCGWLYEIDTNIKDDTMIMHQVMYKFRSTTSNRGEPSNLKYLAWVELKIDQWELGDFFIGYKEDKKNTVRGSNKKSLIDFSYMDYDGTRIYAPADGDVTLQLYHKYKADMIKNHREQEYIYGVEVIVSMAIGYMEFYGHRLDEAKIEAVREKTRAEIALIESEIRQIIRYSNEEELRFYNELKYILGKVNKGESSFEELNKAVEELKQSISLNLDMELNLASPAQVSELFYDKLGIPFSGEKKSVAKGVIKALLKEKDEDGKPKYPVVHLYSDYKKKDTLMTKFFDNLPNFMYPGGFIFSSFGQISTATGRMSCSKPNVQQYPKDVTKIVVPRNNYIMLDADYSQIEYRVLVALSGEEHLAGLFSDPDSDYHTLMASLMFGVPYASVTPKMRGDAKSFNFGIPYGMGFGSLAVLLTGTRTKQAIEEAKEKYELYFKDQPKTRKFFSYVKEMAQVNKYTKTHWNRYRYYSFVDKDGKENQAHKAAALRQAGNAVIQGTAADIFKISVARNWLYIRKNNLIGKLLITNMVHDEQLFEIDVKSINIDKALVDLGINMQFTVEGFPPLYVGAGVGKSWADAKGKMAEIHPDLLKEITVRSKAESIWVKEDLEPNDVVERFNKLVFEFRKKKVYDYITNTDNFGKDLHPAIGNLLNLQFSFGHDKDKEGLGDTEFTELCLAEYIKEYGVEGVSVEDFKVSEKGVDIEEDIDYDDGEEEDWFDEEGNYLDSNFVMLDESDVVFGTDIHELIGLFKCVVAPHLSLCGIDINNMSRKVKDGLTSFLSEHVCAKEDEGSMEIVFLKAGNVLNRTGVYVRGIDGSEVEKAMAIDRIEFGSGDMQ